MCACVLSYWLWFLHCLQRRQAQQEEPVWDRQHVRRRAVGALRGQRRQVFVMTPDIEEQLRLMWQQEGLRVQQRQVQRMQEQQNEQRSSSGSSEMPELVSSSSGNSEIPEVVD